MIKTIKDMVVGKGFILLMIGGGIMAYYKIIPSPVGRYGCGVFCIWIGSFLYVFGELIRVDWSYVLKKKNTILKDMLTLGTAMGNMIISTGIITFILDQFYIIRFPLFLSVLFWILGGYISAKYEIKNRQNS
ncbi:MAG: hypothetical protein PHV08_00745 [Sulfurovaceae bacterium]|nr:hypothetical protein [Sulfurovaceae bacterium]